MKLGFIGSGKIASSVINGIYSSKISFTKILISAQNKKISKTASEKIQKSSNYKR
jgi:pyrroline-5-carboxylate reductase